MVEGIINCMKSMYGRPWRAARKRFLARYPLCKYCISEGKVEVATVVDHVKPHRGDQALFWDEGNWQSLCKTHHDSTKQAEEKSGSVLGCDEAGEPLGGWK